jgi:hypothetical protein
MSLLIPRIWAVIGGGSFTLTAYTLIIVYTETPVKYFRLDKKEISVYTAGVSETPNKKPVGRPRKPDKERPRMMAFRIPPEVYAEARQWIPEGERTAVVVACLKRAIARKKQEAAARVAELEGRDAGSD